MTLLERDDAQRRTENEEDISLFFAILPISTRFPIKIDQKEQSIFQMNLLFF